MYDKGKQDVTNHPQNQYFTNLVTALPKLDEAETNLNYHSKKLESLNNDPKVIAAGGRQVDLASIEKGLGTYTIEYEDANTGTLGFGRDIIKKTVGPSDIVNAAIISQMGSKEFRLSDQEKAIYKTARKNIESKYGISAEYFLNNLIPHVAEGKADPRLMRDFDKAIGKYIPNVKITKKKGKTIQQIELDDFEFKLRERIVLKTIKSRGGSLPKADLKN